MTEPSDQLELEGPHEINDNLTFQEWILSLPTTDEDDE